MKTIIAIILITLIVGVLASVANDLIQSATSDPETRQTEGNLSFSVRTATYNGAYAPRNAGVIWITNAQNQFVKTIKIWAATYRYTLVRWNASSSGNTTGAITGASLNNHQLHNVTWNGTDYQGNQVPDGEYKINVEFTEHNATATNLGKYKQIVFVKGPAEVNQTIPNEQYFRDMTLIWQPVVANGFLLGTVTDTSGSPVGGANVLAGSFSVLTNAAGSYEMSLPPGNYDVTCTAPAHLPQTVNGVAVVSAQTTEQNFLLGVVANSDALHEVPGLILGAPRPNPFSSSTCVAFHPASRQSVELSVFNLRGQQVFTHSLCCDSDAMMLLSWDGKDARGRKCEPGTYLMQVRQGGLRASQKIQLTR